MKISVLCSEATHPVYPWLLRWCNDQSSCHRIEIVQRKKELTGGNILFLISCHEIVESSIRSLYDHSLVVHASDLPRGRGWSPMIWQILEGKTDITVSLLEAEDSVDSGKIWHQKIVHLEGHELFDEINNALFKAEIDLMNFAIENESTIEPKVQSDDRATYYRKRKPEDSKIDPEMSIASQFNLLRVADPERYPAFFEYFGRRYKILISKMEINENE